MGWLGRLFGPGIAREVQPGVYAAKVIGMTHDGHPVTSLWGALRLYRAMQNHKETCTLLEPHSVMLRVQHQPLPWGQAESYVYLKGLERGVFKVFILTRETDGAFMMDPRLGDKWGELQLNEDYGATLVVDARPVPRSYYNY